MAWLPDGEKKCNDRPMFSRFDTIPACVGQTDRQMDGRTNGHLATVVRAIHSIALKKSPSVGGRSPSLVHLKSPRPVAEPVSDPRLSENWIKREDEASCCCDEMTD